MDPAKIIRSIIIKRWSLLILIPLVILSQIVLLKPHLKFGFSDVDWGYLAFYKNSVKLYPNLVQNFSYSFSQEGVYTHQSYYIGLQEHFFGLNFKDYQIIIHVFKTLATLSFYPIFLLLSGSTLIAFLSVILLAFAYPTIGTMYTTVTSSDYTAVLSMGLFVWYCWYIIKKRKVGLGWLFGYLMLFLVTLLLSTERMYPLIAIIFIAEIFLLFINRSRQNFLQALTRVSVLLSPVIIIFAKNPSSFLSFPTNNGGLMANVLAGNFQLILTPFIALGSLLLPQNLWRYLGVVRIESLSEYAKFLISGPLALFTILTAITGVLLFKRSSIIFILQTLIITTLLSLTAYYPATHYKTQFDSSFLTPAIIGFYLLSFAIASFLRWRKTREQSLIGLFAGPFLAFIYIFVTWSGADIFLVFSGPHRYLTVPAVGSSFFLGTLVILVIKKLWLSNSFVKLLIIFPLIWLILLLRMDMYVTNEFFQSYLNNGFGAEDKTYMRSQLLSYLDGLSSKEPSLFYFDLTEDQINGYYYDNTILGGFKTWMLWHKKINFNQQVAPELFWNPPSQLSAAKVTQKNEEIGLMFNGQFYSTKNFYAFKLKDRKVIDITSFIKDQLNLYSR